MLDNHHGTIRIYEWYYGNNVDVETAKLFHI